MKRNFKVSRNGVQYFDVGGTALPAVNTNPNGVGDTQNNTGANPAGALGKSPITNPSQYILPAATNGVTSFAQPLDSANQSIFNHAGGILQGYAQAFTPQNNFQAQLAPTQQTDYSGIIPAAANNSLSGYGQVQGNVANQNALAQAMLAQTGTLQNEAQGGGPNPAQAMLNNSTGANVANQAALAASQRGANANAGLTARNAAVAGAGIQENAAGQAAALQAQQQLAAQQQLMQQQQATAGTYNQIGNELTGEQGVNNNLFTGAAGAQNTQNTGLITNYNDAQNINAGVSAQNTAADQKTTGGIMNMGTSLIGGLLAKGGEIPDPKTAKTPPGERLSNAFYPQHLKDVSAIYHAEGGWAGPMNMQVGGGVPGKAKAPGNDYKNDTVAAMLSPGEVVIPRSVMQSADPVQGAADFVSKLQSQKGESGGGEKEDFKEALKKAISGRKKK
jgi:hypothetical protein